MGPRLMITMTPALTLLATLVLLDVAGSRAAACPLRLSLRARRCSEPCFDPCTPCPPILDECSSLQLPEKPPVVPHAKNEGIIPADFGSEASTGKEPAGVIGSMGDIRPTGFLLSFLSPTGAPAEGLLSISPFIARGGAMGGSSGFGGGGPRISGGGGDAGGADGDGGSGWIDGPRPGAGPGPAPNVTPEPSALVLAGVGVACLLVVRGRLRRATA